MIVISRARAGVLFSRFIKLHPFLLTTFINRSLYCEVTAGNMDAAYKKIEKHIDEHKNMYIERLREAVAIPSVSGEPERRRDVIKMVNWMKTHLERLGVKTELIQLGKQTLPDGNKLDIAPALFGTLGNDPKKKTLLIYGHLDVQPAYKEDGWNTEPFQLVEKDGKLFGRGSTDDKGPNVAWINALEAFKETQTELPINIKFCFEAMEESGSEGLEEALRTHSDFLKGIDFTCISDNYWLGRNKPCLTYGLRGLAYYAVEISGCKQDLHSGVFGGTVFEPMNDVIWILSQLTDLNGTIRIPQIYELVRPVTDEERNLYAPIDFDVDYYKNSIGAVNLTQKAKADILMNVWRNPSLSIHGIEGAYSGPGGKTIIPCKVTGKFSIRLVPDMLPEKVNKIVIDHLSKLWKTRGSPNTMRAYNMSSGMYWLSDYKHPHFKAGARAIKRVFGMEPDYTREGGSIPITLTFEELTKNNVMLLPIGACDDMAHSQNEKINVENYIKGTKTLAAYLIELSDQ
ncbi:hypothetical protein AB6A40_004054 [Gnathostoma spinigerum]|uniref:Peptidase M20 dimerisation domain-containing protein n=1 Tax=Gnathostoma spinigerum TaxID=75299 RepID=A0ABD6EBC9_9BILA